MTGCKTLTPETAKRGTIIIDKHSSERYLIIWSSDKSLDCLDQKFNRVSLGIKWIDSYCIYDKIDMNSFLDWLIGGSENND